MTLSSIELLMFFAISGLGLLVGLGSLYLPLIPYFSYKWVYYHYRIRKPAAWGLLVASLALAAYLGVLQDPPTSWIVAVSLNVLALIMSYRVHQERVFVAVDFPKMSERPYDLPIGDEEEIALIHYNGEFKAYPLQFVVHHHVVNDSFGGDRTVSLTYCAMCRSVIPFDVTEIGPLFVASFKRANLIVADRRTKTFFQQASFESLIGPLHPMTLKMIPFQILSWENVKALGSKVQVPEVTEHDFREFELPIPGLWKKIITSEVTPGLREKDRDTRFSARTRVIGVHESGDVYLKEDVLSTKVIHDPNGYSLLATGSDVVAFRDRLDNQELDLALEGDRVVDKSSGARWELSGAPVSGTTQALSPVAISDVNWFAWKLFHPSSTVHTVRS